MCEHDFFLMEMKQDCYTLSDGFTIRNFWPVYASSCHSPNWKYLKDMHEHQYEDIFLMLEFHARLPP
jgi:hypothetical protein